MHKHSASEAVATSEDHGDIYPGAHCTVLARLFDSEPYKRPMKSRTLFLLIFLLLVFKNSRGQYIETLAGNGIEGYTDSMGVLLNAEFNHPYGLVFDRKGNLFIADHVNSAIRRISTSGVISTFAGTTTFGYSGDSSQATAATMKRPTGIAIDKYGNLYIADAEDNRIRKVDTSGIIFTYAGAGLVGYSGDGGPADSALFNNPCGVATDIAGNVYVADSGNNVIRVINPSGIISTFAGTGTSGYSGDGGPATAATLAAPVGVTTGSDGSVYVAEAGNNVIRKILPDATIITFAGNGIAGDSANNIPATAAELYAPSGLALDNRGNVYISDEKNNRIRVVDTAGIITILAGNGHSGFSGDNGPATDAELFWPKGVAVDSNYNIYIADNNNNVIRKTRPHTARVNDPVAAGISIHPNPAREVVYITATAALPERVELVNMTGQVVKQQHVFTREADIDISDLPAGCYILNCYSGGIRICKKMAVKQ